MKWSMFVGALVLSMSLCSSQQSYGFELLDRMLGAGCGCEAACGCDAAYRGGLDKVSSREFFHCGRILQFVVVWLLLLASSRYLP